MSDEQAIRELVATWHRATMAEDHKQVLQLMAEGLSNRAISERMVVTERAVERHVTSIFSKLRLNTSGDDHRRVMAVLAYLKA